MCFASSNPRSLSKFENLPIELIDYIFEIVAASKSDSRYSIAQILPTSRLFQSIRFRWLRRSICLLQLTARMARQAPFIIDQSTRRLLLSFQDLSNSDPKMINIVVTLLKLAPRLDTLVLYLCENVKSESLRDTIQSLPLKVLDFGSFSNKVSIEFPDLLHMIRNSKTLRTVSWEVCGVLAELPKRFEILYSEGSVSNLTTIRISAVITDVALLALIESCKGSLKSLSIRTTSMNSLLSSQALISAISSCPKLTTLSLDLAATNSIEISSFPNSRLLSLSLSAPPRSQLTVKIEAIAKLCPGLVNLSLKGMVKEKEEIKLVSIIRTMSSLKRVNLELEAGSEEVEWIEDELMKKGKVAIRLNRRARIEELY